MPMRIDVMILGECIEGDEKAAWDRSLGKFSFSGRIEEDNLSKEDEGCPDSVTVLSWRLVEVFSAGPPGHPPERARSGLKDDLGS